MSALTRDDIDRLLPGLPWWGYKLAEPQYVRPSKEWLLDTFCPWWVNWLKSQGLTYSAKYDCDDFARDFCANACRAHAETLSETPGAAIAEVWFTRADKKGDHAIALAICENDELVFVEPQTGKQVDLCADEIASIWYARF